MAMGGRWFPSSGWGQCDDYVCRLRLVGHSYAIGLRITHSPAVRLSPAFYLIFIKIALPPWKREQGEQKKQSECRKLGKYKTG